MFLKAYCYYQSQKMILDDIFWDILHCQIQLFSGRPINNVKRSFEIFLIDHYAGDIENKNIGKY